MTLPLWKSAQLGTDRCHSHMLRLPICELLNHQSTITNELALSKHSYPLGMITRRILLTTNQYLDISLLESWTERFILSKQDIRVKQLSSRAKTAILLSKNQKFKSNFTNHNQYFFLRKLQRLILLDLKRNMKVNMPKLLKSTISNSKSNRFCSRTQQILLNRNDN